MAKASYGGSCRHSGRWDLSFIVIPTLYLLVFVIIVSIVDSAYQGVYLVDYAISKYITVQHTVPTYVD